MKIEGRKKQEIMVFLEQKVVNYPPLEITKLYHGCGKKKHRNGFNVIIDKRFPCQSPMHRIYWFRPNTRRFKMTNSKYITRWFYNELKQKGYGKVVMENCVIYVD